MITIAMLQSFSAALAMSKMVYYSTAAVLIHLRYDIGPAASYSFLLRCLP
jgi:hypothetical protein